MKMLALTHGTEPHPKYQYPLCEVTESWMN